jgi:hypothetical protein
MKVSWRFQKPQETITHEGFSWEPKSARNVFPADFLSKSAGKKHICSSMLGISHRIDQNIQCGI